MEHVAILTGDLIASTSHAAAVQTAMAAIAAAAEDIAALSGTDPRFTRFRGDGWQFRVPVALTLRSALLVAARLRARGGLGTRIAIGLGTLDHAGTRDLSDAAGPAFTASGRALDHMPRGQRWAIAGEVQAWQGALVTLAKWHSARWSAEQAEAMALMLAEPDLTQAAAAGRLGITRQAWAARLAGAGYGAWRPALAAFERASDG